MDILKEIQKSLKEIGVNQVITKNTKFSEIGVDSLDLMELIMKKEQEYKIYFEDEELLKIKTINDLINLINEKRN